MIAVDWTGAREPLKGLWLAEARPAEGAGARATLIDVRPFPRRADLVAHVIAERERHARLAVGLDFAFSLPGWFLDQLRLPGARELWEHMAREAESWLAPRAPFWRSAGESPPPERRLRRTDEDLRRRGLRPSSAFQLVGPSQVGAGSLRGMPALAELERAAFRVWPFSSGLPLVVEIYPAGLAGGVRKSDAVAVARAVRDDERIPERWKAHSACCADAFDAAMSALCMAEHAEELASLGPAQRGSPYAREGQIWMPAGASLYGSPHE